MLTGTENQIHIYGSFIFKTNSYNHQKDILETSVLKRDMLYKMLSVHLTVSGQFLFRWSRWPLTQKCQTALLDTSWVEDEPC